MGIMIFIPWQLLNGTKFRHAITSLFLEQAVMLYISLDFILLVEWVIRLHINNVCMKNCLYLLNTCGRNKHGKAYTSCLAIISCSWEGIILKNIWKGMKNIMNLNLSTCKAWILDHWSNQVKVSVTMQVNLKVMWKGTWMSTKTAENEKHWSLQNLPTTAENEKKSKSLLRCIFVIRMLGVGAGCLKYKILII
jgi:hypothetical protein